MPRPDTVAQLPLDLPFEERRGRDDFFVSASNEAADAAIESWPQGWIDPLLILAGPEGAGKSHLAGVWAQRAHAWRIDASLTPDQAPHLVSKGALLIEDVDRVDYDEPALFHLINAAQARGGHLLMTARADPGQWRIATPDLMSRLRRAPVARIEPPDDGLLRALLVKLFVDRQLAVDVRVIETILARGERSFAAARAIVDAIDQTALAAGRRITPAMAQATIASLCMTEERS